MSGHRLAISRARSIWLRRSNLGRKPSSWLAHPTRKNTLVFFLVGMPRFELGPYEFLMEIPAEA
ncbi:MAG: hypothetical protein A2836_02810 [Candidatus Taylorbacteria bacterium RIFCSPHIGHO2_01_FULL_45_63]|uniref:Uncharacterized protein n=1 Tax=Candidatus Taylorbacteria bacterium RIFCSPHIGHO2_02_FULL_45_35 TaxID=1802311 RepID=A0A1G2MTR4_9BACT|nr:MAG: hypothetical protein A2836_02810 [Candidatus Taylorbacteria bacterium RIFCSPHIGHO2_01_FULL_45_63]OHA26629.1 MAG: hypothetical protein A3D56_02225 [Candidatus Taylorbacteria bacterium RIFCSPHIGHO2_02_FULL_45_35]OHA33560.1 MAG: hypothetical protein A3A22_03530 [Candidatus Taylorbacteria bacterium RIFCSPLOWO2_01_FULL_45_34b]